MASADPELRMQAMRPVETITDAMVLRSGHMVGKDHRLAHRCAFTAMILVVSGRGDFQADDGPVQLIAAGSTFVLHPGPVFRFGPPAGETWEEYHLCLDGARVAQWRDAGWLPCDGRVYSVADPSSLVWQFRRIAEVLRDPMSGNADRAVCFAEQLLVELFYRRTEARRQLATDATMAEVLLYCRDHLAQPVDFRRLARSMGVSYSLLRQRMRHITGMAPGRYLSRLRCDEARRLLWETDLPIAEIGERVGMVDPYGFSRSFKRVVGISPARFRDRVRLSW